MRNKYGIYELKIHGSTSTNTLEQSFKITSLLNDEDKKLFDNLTQVSKLIYIDYDVTYGGDVGKVIYKGFTNIKKIAEGSSSICFTLSNGDSDMVYEIEIYKESNEYWIYPIKLIA